jgi:Holliday junction resolvasome RuvABC endonuclease subunit
MIERILALDQSSKVTGYSIWNNGVLEKYDKFSFIDTDVIVRIVKLKNAIDKLIKDENIDKVILEEIQMQKMQNNVVTFKVLAQVQGAILILCNENAIPYEVVASSTWKSVCGVKGKVRADQKRDAQRFVEEKFGVKPIQDIVDAICIGYSSLQRIDFK